MKLPRTNDLPRADIGVLSHRHTIHRAGAGFLDALPLARTYIRTALKLA